MSTDPRHIAFEVMTAVREKDAYVNLLLPTILRERRIDARDAALATELTHGTLRRQGSYDAIINALATREVDPAVRDALRLGAHQLLAMRIPQHAAVDTTVRLVRRHLGHKPVGFVNALLRRISSRTAEQWWEDLTVDLPRLEALALRHSHPLWIVEALRDVAGDVELEDLLAAHNAPPKVTLVARPGLCDPSELPGVPGKLSPWARILESGGDPASIAAVRDGRAGVQDEGSQMVAVTAAEVSLEGTDARWLDMCAGPGGKTALWAALGASRGAHVEANEVLPHRAELVRNAVRALDNVDVVCHDGRQGPWTPGEFDRVLVDAPCTGLGALRRRPEARWRRRIEDLADLTALQEALLRRALEVVRPGGIVAYSTCSPILPETTELVARVRDTGVVVEAEHRWWPHRDGTDAMYVAILRRL